jgi:tetratricopeptide (TPR) repeat protein
MVLLESIKNFFSLKGKERPVFFIALSVLLFIWSCAGSTYHDMAVQDPSKLVSLQDSLSQNGLSTNLIRSLTLAHKTLGEIAYEEGEHEVATHHFSNALKLSPKDTSSLYGALMVEAHLLYRTGKKEKLWDSIENYHKAALLRSHDGEPYYYIGCAYHKIGDKDFDLIMEAYDRALSLDLNPRLRSLAQKARSEAADRDQRLKDFWK